MKPKLVSGNDVSLILLDQVVQILLLRRSSLVSVQQAIILHLAHGVVRGCIAIERDGVR
jgi:hypothetical protein